MNSSSVSGLSETAVNGSKPVVLCTGIGLHIIGSLRAGQRRDRRAKLSMSLSSRPL